MEVLEFTSKPARAAFITMWLRAFKDCGYPMNSAFGRLYVTTP
jgi:hypothetical protein